MTRKILVLALLGLVSYSSAAAQQLAWQQVGKLQRGIGFFEVAMLSTSRVLVMGGAWTISSGVRCLHHC